MKIVLFKSRSDDYEEPFASSGLRPEFLEPLDFKFVNLSQLRERTAEPAARLYDGLVVTSPRAIDALSESMDDTSLSKWKTKKIYAVGEASEAKIKSLFDWNAGGSSSGNAENLSKFIINENGPGARFLFPCGNIKSETIIKNLAEKGIIVEPLTVYETEENSDLQNRLLKLLTNEEQDLAMVFFSPSGATFVHRHLQSMHNLPNIHYFAIGNSTSKQMEALKIKVSGVASRPSAQCLLEVVKSVLSHTK